MARQIVVSSRGLAGTGGGGARQGGSVASGGLVSVVAPALARHNGLWLAVAPSGPDAAGTGETRQRRVQCGEGTIQTRTLPVGTDRFGGFYNRVSNQLLWFLHHDLLDLARAPVFDRGFHDAWEHYAEVNKALALTCARVAQPTDTVFAFDYHLSLFPEMLRTIGSRAPIAHVSLTRWADPVSFSVLPDRYAKSLLDGILGADMVVFLTPRWAANFVGCAAGAGYSVDRSGDSVWHPGGRRIPVRSFPVGVDADRLFRLLRSPAGQTALAELTEQADSRRLVVRTERLEPAKNILRGLAAFDELLARRPDLRTSVVHYVLAYTSRTDVPEYQRYASDVGRKVTELNRRWNGTGRPPVILETRNDHARGLAAMALSSVLVVNPLWDGMNLIAKEGPVVNRRDGVLVLSRNAGAADELGPAATLVNPFDVTDLADAIEEALSMDPEERARRAEFLRGAAAAHPPQEWLARVGTELSAVVRDGER